MFAQRDFVACIEGQLVERGFGAKRKAEVLDHFGGLVKNFRDQGYGPQIAQSMAMSKIFDDIALRTRDRSKAAAKMLEVQASNEARVNFIDAMPERGKFAQWFEGRIDGGTGRGALAARIGITTIQADPRMPGLSAENIRDSLRGRYWAMLSDSVDKYGKGSFGTQKGKAGQYDLIREIFSPGSTKNADAATFVKAYTELDGVMVADRNRVGGNLRQLENYFPQRTNAAAALKAGYDTWRAKQRWDWDRMTWPNGEHIAADQREDVMKQVFRTITSQGKNKIDPASFGGRGSALGNELDNHRFVHYEDADAWIANHEAFGDGSVFDVLSAHVEGMAHKSALVQVFGRNPQLGFENLVNTILSKAEKLQQAGDKKAIGQAERVINNRLRPMFEGYSRSNPMDSDSVFASTIMATSNLLTAAQLNSAVMLAMPGDFAQTLAVRMANHMPLLDGMGKYFGAFTTEYDKLQGRMARAGFIFDNQVGATYTTERFSPIATYGPVMTRHLSDGMMRASLMNRHTEIARATSQHEMMGLLWDNIKESYDSLPFKNVLQRYGIGAAEWDAARKAIAPWSPEPGAEFFRPMDLLNTTLGNKDELYTRFYSMINQEAKYMVPGATLEANVTLSRGMRPDTMVGAMLNSFKMYKNFPITFAQMYGRMAMSQERTLDKLGFAAAIIGGATIVGAMGTQLRELIKGRTPMAMDRATFWGKAFMAGGGASIYGDILFGGVNDRGQGLEVFAGPVAGAGVQAMNTILHDPFKWVGAWDNDAAFKSTFASRAAAFAKQNTPGTSMWWARLALEREVWDTLDELADPHAHAKARQRERQRSKQNGNRSWWEPMSGVSGITGP